MQNIGEANQGDAFYRYKMPKLVAKIEGRGNGIKTNVVNNVDIARALDRPPTYTLKHFGCELGAQTNFDKKTGTSIVNGAHDAKKLSEVLEIFIKKYVQCYSCGNPETIVKVRRECIFLKCKACGHTSDVDMRDKLTTFIVKNPPENKLSKAEAKVKKDEKERMKAAEKEAKKAEKAETKEKSKKKKEKSKERKSQDENDDGAAGSNSDDAEANTNVDAGDEEEDDGTEWKTDMSAEAVARRQREQLTHAAASLVQGPAAVTEQPSLNGEMSATSFPTVEAVPEEEEQVEPEEEGDDDDDEDLPPEERVRKYINNSNPPLELLDYLGELEIPGGLVGKMKVFYAALLSGREGKIADRIAPLDKYVLALKQDDTHQACNLIALEHYVTQVEPERMLEMPFLLKMLYEEDLVEDHVIVGWGEAAKAAKKYGVDADSAAKIRESCQKVLEWLEEDSDEEDEEE